MKRQLCVSGSPEPTTRRRKRLSRLHPKSSESLAFSPDILHTIFSFLVSENGCIDGESIKSASLVCKKWRDVAVSRSLWSIPTNLQGDAVLRKDSISISLSLWDSSPYDGRLGGQSLMGFLKIRLLETSRARDDTSRFLATEKATGKECILSIANSNEISSGMIKEVFRGHQKEQENFLCPHLESVDRSVPRGIRVLNNRVVRWYEHGAVRPVTPSLDTTHRCDGDFQQNNEYPMSQMLRLQDTQGQRDPLRRRLRSDAWAMIVDWIAEIADCFGLEDDAIFRAMDMVDRIVSTTHYNVKKRYYQLVSAACLQIASKCGKEISATDICMCSDNSFTVADLAKTEEFLLTKLEWKLAFPSALDFLNQLRVILDLEKDSRMFQLMRYISELALQTKLYVHFEPSMVAATAVVLSNYSLDNQELWPDLLEQHTNYSLEDLAECTIAMSRLLEDVRLRYPNLIIIDQRYRKQSRGCVAEVPIPTITSFASLISYQQQNPNRVPP